jgi:uncharacterized protein (TIGR02284 family)
MATRRTVVRRRRSIDNGGSSMANQTTETVDQLNSFLRSEMAAVETYKQALEKLDQFPQRTTLESCARSHEERVQKLAEEIRRRGGTPSQGSGAWGGFTSLIQGGANLFGAKAAIAALEEGEDHGRNDYKRDLDSLEPSAKSFVQNELLPEQHKTHDTMSRLKKSLS